jgi:hypothetical protein
MHVASGVYRAQKRQLFRKRADLSLRYKLPSSFYRVATLTAADGFGLRLEGVHPSACVGDEIVMDLRLPDPVPAVSGKIAWASTELAAGTMVVGVQIPESVDPAWVTGLTMHLFRDKIRPLEVTALTG